MLSTGRHNGDRQYNIDVQVARPVIASNMANLPKEEAEDPQSMLVLVFSEPQSCPPSPRMLLKRDREVKMKAVAVRNTHLEPQ